ncbi:MAG: ABC transporter permease [Oligoflexia bacterium]|nr:ABC transporter permease [Oligoflexia bacterium]
MLRTFSKNKGGFNLFTVVAWVWAISFVLAPLCYVILISFARRGTYGGVVFDFTFNNYLKILDSGLAPLVLSSFLRSVLMAFLTTFSCLLMAFPLSYFLVFKSGKYKNLLFFLLLVPFWTQFLIRVYAWMSLLSDNGMLSKILGTSLLFTTKAIFIGMVYNYLPYMALSLYVNLEKLDPLLLDAASDLGASRFIKTVKVILPLTMPGIVAGCIMVFIPALGEFVIPDILGGSKQYFVGNLLAQQFLSARDWPFGAALSVILILIMGASFFAIAAFMRGKKIEEMI